MKTKTRNDVMHAQILLAAQQQFVERGAAKTSVSAIAKAAKVSRNTFYRHFAGTDAVLREMMHGVWDDVLQVYRRFSELPDWKESSISGWLNEYFDYAVPSMPRYRIVAQYLADELLAQSSSREWRNIKALIGNSSQWNRFQPDEAHRRARLLIYLLERLSLDCDDGSFVSERQALVHTLTEMWLATLRCPRRNSGRLGERDKTSG